MNVTSPLFIILLVVYFSGNGIQAQNITTTKGKDLRTFLSDRNLVTRQINCVLGKGQCDRLGTQIKKAIPEVLHRNCARCTTGQASNAKKLINFIQNHYPTAYREVLQKYRKKMGSTGRQPTTVNRTNPEPSTNVTSKRVSAQETKISTVQSPSKAVTIETAQQANKVSSVQSAPEGETMETALQAERSSEQSPLGGVIIETAQQAKTSSVQSPQKGVTIETALQAKTLSVQSPEKGVTIETAQQTITSSVQSHEKGETIETVDSQPRPSSERTIPKGVILEAARHVFPRFRPHSQS